MAERAATAGGRLTHILHGESGFMYSPDLLHALTFPNEWRISPAQFGLLPRDLQKAIEGRGFKIKEWTEKERDAFRRGTPEPHEAHPVVEPVIKPVEEPKPRKAAKPKKAEE